jgi:glycosyltransferase involved in cell wall biosynthesis
MVGSRAPRIVFVEQFFYPEGWGGAQLPRDVTIDLARSGAAVEVVCGSDQYATVEGDATEDPTSSGVRIRRIPRLIGGDIHRLKLLRQLWFYACALPMLLFRRRPDLIVTQTNPPLVVPIAMLAAAVHRRPGMIIAQDIYPEVMLAHGMLEPGSPATRLLARLFAWAYRRARTVVSLGPVMTQRLLAKGVARERVVEICNWATGEESVVRGRDNRLRGEWGLDGCFVLLYSGNLGIAHDVETPIHAVQALRARLPNLRLLFVGKGSRLGQAQALVRELGLGDVVQFRGFVPLELLPHSLGLADAALVTLLPGFEGLVVPSKLLGYMARGVPTLYVGPDSDVARFIERSRGGASVAAGDVAAFTRVVEHWVADPAALRAAGDAAASYYVAGLSRQRGLEAYREAVAAAVGAAASTGTP